MKPSSAQKRFGKKVQYFRKEAGLTQEKLSELTGLDRGYISGVERGVRNPAIQNIEKIAKALKVKPAKLFE